MAYIGDIWGEIFRKNLKKWRERHFPGHGGKTKCAKALGVTLAEWGAWEGGKRTPNEKNIKRIAELFEIDPIDLIYVKPSEKFLNKNPELKDCLTLNVSPQSLPIIGTAAADNSESSKAGLLPPDNIEELTVLKEEYKLIQVIGDSMEPVILNGQYVVIGHEIPNDTPIKKDGWIGVVQAYCKDTDFECGPDDICTFCKRIYKVKGENELLLLTSTNSSECPPFTIERNKIIHLWPVQGVFFAGKGNFSE